MIHLAQWLPNRERKRRPTLVVLHYDAGVSAWASISWLRKLGFGYHVIIPKAREGGGEPIKCVPLSKVASHAGLSVGPRGSVAGNSVNDDSIGLCMVNRNDGKDPWERGQYDRLVSILREIGADYPGILVTTHAIVSPRRKTDPLGFPSERAAHEAGLGFWRGPKLGTSRPKGAS